MFSHALPRLLVAINPDYVADLKLLLHDGKINIKSEHNLHNLWYDMSSFCWWLLLRLLFSPQILMN